MQPPLPARGQRITWSGLLGASESLAMRDAAERHDGPMVIVTRDVRRLHVLAQELEFFARPGADPVLVFPDWECLPYDLFSPHQDIISERLRILSLLPALSRGIVMIAADNLAQRLPPAAYVLGHSIELAVGQRLNIDGFRERLQQSAYYAVSQVAMPGEYAVRGGLLDLFPMGAESPIRIDLFDDVIDSLRWFDPEDQRSRDTLDSIRLLPAREFPLDPESIKRFRSNFRRRFEGDPMRQNAYEAVSNGTPIAGLEYFFPLFFDATATFADFVPESTLWVLDHDIDAEFARFHAEVLDRYENSRLDPERRVLPPEELFLDPAGLAAMLDRRPVAALGGAGEGAATMATLPPEQAAVDMRAEQPYAPLVELLSAPGRRRLLVAETAGRREALESILVEHGIDTRPVAGWHEFLELDDELPGLCVAALERGICLVDPPISVITESQLYGERVFQRRRRSARNRDPESVIRSLAELEPGDPVVHEDHGIGRYQGLTTLGIEGESNEFLLIRYRDGDKLYVPILALDRVSRYLGGDADSAPLHKLGSDTWEKARNKAREKAYDVAAELLEVAALREARAGRSMPVPTDAYRDFRERFPFEETPDQQQVIDEVLTDLASDAPMDRLVCGDVGFGKTEVALRAAFVAVHNRCQVVMLVPTTLLAQQHFQTFQDRFADLPVEVELLSRFRTRKDIDRLVASLQRGYPDIVVGTHRLLQPDIRFKNLGLVIIDEEHRFGVRQKEQLKKLRGEVDVLTLSATPIPRTLNMSMSGLRSISIIATPPVDRLSVKTFVRPYNKALVREAILREIHRGGQVYFLHNEVRTMERMRSELAELVPEARIEIGHGQMAEVELERVMRDFYHQRFNVLLCSTIVESGIDVPSANTIIINRADRFGLAQLHQLRGRVGRSHHQAFAYLLVADLESVTGDARKRLEAIDSLEELGAGFTLASHDLEIRGAGELLGESQSGTIDSVGFTLFAEYLNRAVAALKSGRAGDLDAAGDSRAADVNLGCPALLPEDYIPDVHTRLVLYKRIAAAGDQEALRELRIEVIDRFGLLPEAAGRLFDVTWISHRAGALGIDKIALGGEGGSVTFGKSTSIPPDRLIGLFSARPGVFRMSGAYQLNVRMALPEVDSRIALANEILGALGD